MTKTTAQLTEEINAARAAQDWGLVSELTDQRRCAEVDADEATVSSPTPVQVLNDIAQRLADLAFDANDGLFALELTEIGRRVEQLAERQAAK